MSMASVKLCILPVDTLFCRLVLLAFDTAVHVICGRAHLISFTGYGLLLDTYYGLHQISLSSCLNINW